MRLARFVAIPVLLFILSGCRVPALVQPEPSGPSVSGAGETQVIVFSPTGTPGNTAQGYCWVRSLAAWRPGAWRCMSGNFIHDPCFSTSDGASWVTCVPDPLDEKKNLRLNLDRPLPVGEPTINRTHAWALALDDGTVCSYFTGATGPIDGQRLNYGCANGWDIVGEPAPDRIWTVREVLLKPRSLVVVQSRQAKVRTVWE